MRSLLRRLLAALAPAEAKTRPAHQITLEARQRAASERREDFPWR